MAVALDAKGTAASSTAAATSLTDANLTVGASATALVYFVVFEKAVNVAGVTAVWDSGGTNQSMTQRTFFNNGNGSTCEVMVFCLINPTPGNKTFSVSWTGTNICAVYGLSFTGTDRRFGYCFNNIGHNSAPLTTTAWTTNACATTANDLVVGICNGPTAGNTFSGITGTTDITFNTAGIGSFFVAHQAGSSGSFTVSGTATTSDLDVGIAINVGGQGPINQYDWPPPNPGPPFNTPDAYTITQNLMETTLAPLSPATIIKRPPLISNPTPQPLPGPTWTQGPLPNLRGQDRVYGPPGMVSDYDWPLPGRPPVPDGTWVQNLLQNTLKPVSTALPFNTYDWPTPRDFDRASSYSITEAFNLNLVGQDRFFGAPGQVAPQRDWPLPVAPEPDWRRSWTWSYNLNLIGKDALPFRQTDWPLPQPIDTRPDRSFTFSLRPGALLPPFRQQDWPLPNPGADPSSRRSWEFSFNLNLIGADAFPIRQMDWPLPPRGVEPDWRRSWEWAYNRNLVGLDALPFRQTDWPLQLPPPWYRGIEFTSPQTILLFTPPPPFAQHDWPLPVAIEPDPRRGFTASFPLTLIGQDRLPFRQLDWPLPQVAAPLLQTWIFVPRPGFLLPPFRQQDWPLPGAYAALDPDPRRSFTASYNPNLVGQDALPFRQVDWPLPRGVEPWYRSLELNLLQTTLFVVPASLPFNTYDWPLPRGIDPYYSTYYASQVSLLTTTLFTPPVITAHEWLIRARRRGRR